MTAALDVLHGLVLDDGRRWGAVAVDWQRGDAEAVLEPDDGAPRLHWLGRPKGGSKTTDLAGMSIAWLVEQAPPMTDGYAVASDHDQANRLLDRARGIIARTVGLDSVLEVQARRIVNRRSGARVHALEADVAGSEGLLSPWFVVDELPNWPETSTARRMWTSVVSAVPKWPGCRLVVIGHAGDPAHWSHSVLGVARAEGWRVVEVDGPLPWVSEADLAMQRALLLPSEFARRHLNVWTSSEDRLTTVDDVRRCVREGGVLAPVRSAQYVLSADLSVTTDNTVVTVAHLEHREAGATVVVDRQVTWVPSKAKPIDFAEVEAFIVEASEAYNDAPLIFDPFQAAHLSQRLRRVGVRTQQFTFSQTSIGRLAVTLFRLLRDGLLELPDDDEALIDELVHVRIVERQPGVFRLDHDSGRHDDRAIGLALCAHELLEGEGRLSRRGGLRFRDPRGPKPDHIPQWAWDAVGT